MLTSADHLFDVGVIGAGPGGVAAAVSAASSGASVVVVDACARPGGQFYRRPASPVITNTTTHSWRAFDRLEERFESMRVAGRITLRSETTVWSASGSGPFALRLRGSEREPDRLSQAFARSVVVATGAYDRHLPFPGWDLAGVLSGGAAQAVVKSSGVLPGSRVVVAGTGPFLLAVAATMIEAGARVVAIVEANSPVPLVTKAPSLVGVAGRGADLARYIGLLIRNRVPYLRRHRVVAAEGEGKLERAVVMPVDRQWHPTGRTSRVFECDALAVGFGFLPQHELLGQLGCGFRGAQDGGIAAVVDAHQRTTVRGVLACGETTGIGGADLALAEGLIAGASAAREVGLSSVLRDGALARTQARVRRLRRAQDSLHPAFPVMDGWISALEADTVVCRCEGVTTAEVDQAIHELGARDARTVKLLSRAGMGWCQGRMCGFSVERMCAASVGNQEATVAPKRPITTPVSLGALAERPSLDNRA